MALGRREFEFGDEELPPDPFGAPAESRGVATERANTGAAPAEHYERVTAELPRLGAELSAPAAAAGSSRPLSSGPPPRNWDSHVGGTARGTRPRAGRLGLRRAIAAAAPAAALVATAAALSASGQDEQQPTASAPDRSDVSAPRQRPAPIPTEDAPPPPAARVAPAREQGERPPARPATGAADPTVGERPARRSAARSARRPVHAARVAGGPNVAEAEFGFER
jgi:hypothetical protein